MHFERRERISGEENLQLYSGRGKWLVQYETLIRQSIQPRENGKVRERRVKRFQGEDGCGLV